MDRKIAKYKKTRCQEHNAQKILDSNIFVQCFLDTIENHIISMKGLELYETTIQKEGDKQNDFVVCKKVTNDNTNTLLTDYTLDDVWKV